MLATTLRTDRAAGMERGLRLLVVAASVFVMLLFLVTALRRWRYPYELEELEGYVYLTALRAFHGQPIYPRPSLEFIPYMYPPLYYYVTAWLGRVMGMTIGTMRMASILSTLGCFAMIYTLVWSEVKRNWAALAAAGVYAGCYTVCQEWFDLGRLDSFFVLLVLVAMYATRRLHPVIAAVVWVLAFQTKQSILPAAFVMLCCHWKDLKKTAAGVVTLAVLAGGSVLWMNHATQGWYSFVVFAVPGANADIKLRTLAVFWSLDVLRPLALAVMVIVAAAVLTRPAWEDLATRFYVASMILVVLFWWIRAHSGSTANALMPIYALVAVLFGISAARLVGWLEALPAGAGQAGVGGLSAKQGAVMLVLGAALVQVAAGVYNPGDYVPARELQASTAAVVNDVRSLPGNVLVLQHPYYAMLAGKPYGADLVSIRDAMRPAHSPIRGELKSQIDQVLAGHQYGSIVFEDPEATTEMDKISGETTWRSYYPIQEPLPGVRFGNRPDWLLEH
jgi:hypothetical protein